MTDSILKNVPNLAEEKRVIRETKDSHITSITSILNDAPIEIIRYFGVDLLTIDEKTREKLKDIYKFCSKNTNGLGEILMKVKDIERKVKNPVNLYEPLYGRVWNWIKISEQINDLEKQRKAFEE